MNGYESLLGDLLFTLAGTELSLSELKSAFSRVDTRLIMRCVLASGSNYYSDTIESAPSLFGTTHSCCTPLLALFFCD